MDIISSLQIQLKTPDDFLKIRETLTRMGIANNQNRILYQSCHILQKRGLYYVVHFKELLALDGRCVEISEEDIERRNNIAKLLEEWNLCEIVNPDNHTFTKDNRFRVITHRDASKWKLVHKYKVGN